jgi:hypothetical protein
MSFLLKTGGNMKPNRIYFKNNPWPEGHPIKEFVWSARVQDGYVWFDFHLETERYYAEREIEDDDDVEYISDWVAPIVWYNFHACTLSTNNWHEGGFKVCALEDYTPEFLNGLELMVDTDVEETEDDWESLAFHIYLLGHDSAAKHKIKFERIGDTDLFNIYWSGKIALAYVGDYEYKYDFVTFIPGVKFPQLGDDSH